MNYSNKKIKNFLKENYNLDINSIKHLGGGVMNINYLCKTENKNYIFKIYNFKNKEEVNFEVEILEFLKDKKFSSPRLISSIGSAIILFFQNKPCILYDFIDGENVEEITPDLIYKIGKAQANLHNLLKNFKPRYQKYGWDDKELKILFNKNKKKIAISGSLDFLPHMNFVEKELVKYKFPKELPTRVTHQDIKSENILFRDREISGIIDFDNSYVGVLLHDITTTIIWTCFVDEKLDFELLKAFINGYSKERKLTELEKQYILDSLKFRLVREVFIGPYVTMHLQNISKERADYFMRLYKELNISKEDLLNIII